jgi:hypothetical protein
MLKICLKFNRGSIAYHLPISAIEKLLKFIQISYGYRKKSEILKGQKKKKHSEFVRKKLKTFCRPKPAIVRLPQSVCKCQIQIPKGGKP